jgi:hypothetical protein
VVSEERGTISIARQGNISSVADSAELAEALENFYDEIAPLQKDRPWVQFFVKNSREKAVALGMAVALWVLVVYRAHPVQQTFEIPVAYRLLPGNLVVSRMEPTTVKVTFSGQRKAFDFVNPGKIKLTLELWDAEKGRHPFAITSRDLAYPAGLELQDIEPRGVMLEIVDKPVSPGAEGMTTNSILPRTK